MKNTLVSTSQSRRAKLLAVSGIYLASSVTTFFSMARSIMLPSILSSLSSMQYYSLIILFSALAMSLTTPIAGKLGDIYGRKKLYVICSLVHMGSFALAAFSTNIVLFLVSVLLSGVSQGFIAAFSSVALAEVTSPEEHPKYLGYSTTVSLIIQMLAPVLGGVIADNFGWRVVFITALPCTLLMVFMLQRYMPKTKQSDTKKQKVDILGTVGFLGAVAPALVLLSVGGTLIPWVSVVTACMAAVTLASVALIIYSNKKSESPMIPFFLFRNKAFMLLFLVSLLMGTASSSAMSYLTYYLQNILQLSATVSGSVVIPKSILSIVLSAVVGVVLSKTGKHKQVLMVLLSLVSVSYIMMIFGFNPETKMPYIIATTMLNGFGASSMIVIVMTMVMHVVPSKDVGIASSFIVFTATFGGALGNALGGMFMNFAWSGISIPSALSAVMSPEHLGELAQTGILKNPALVETMKATLSGENAALLDTTIHSFRQMLNSGLQMLFVAYLVVTVAALALTLLLRPKQDT